MVYPTTALAHGQLFSLISVPASPECVSSGQLYGVTKMLPAVHSNFSPYQVCQWPDLPIRLKFLSPFHGPYSLWPYPPKSCMPGCERRPDHAVVVLTLASPDLCTPFAMRYAPQLVCALALALTQHVAAWGNLGHETIGYVAMQFIGSKTLSFVQTSLGSQYNFSLGPAATWADSVRSEKAFKFSAPFHFIDAEDNPPDSCSVNQARDCGDEGCVLTAIQNYTARVQKPSLGDEQVQEALKFITHFVGDIGQPLHVEALEVGGNDISAVCDGKKTNLHAAWDTGMLEKNLDANFSGDPQVWAAALVKEIQSGSFESDAKDWASCISPSALSSTACPLVWAKEANSFDCSDVFSFTTGEDLCDSAYYTAAIPIITEQIAKQGFRLAKWLDAIFE